MEHEGDSDSNCNWRTWNNPKGLMKGLEDLKIRGQVETIQTKALLRSGQNTEKSPGDWKRIAVTQTLMRNHQLMRVGKTLKRVKQ